MIQGFQDALKSLAENLLDEIRVDRMSLAQIARVQDGDGNGAGVNLCTFNSGLVGEMHVEGPASEKDKKRMLQKISKITLAIMHLASIEGEGIIRYTETVSSLFTNPDNYTERSLRWVDGLLEVCCGWCKTENVAGETALAAKRATMRACTERTSSIFLRCALAVKPLEIRLVNNVFGPEAASVHWHAFCARDGKDLCSDANILWARGQFNSLASLHFGITLHAMRHVWIGLSTRVTDAFADLQSDAFKSIVRNHSARHSHHDVRTERERYAGEAGSIQGHESMDVIAKCNKNT
jgi:hypothetical protein